jgi:hypothetical protein
MQRKQVLTLGRGKAKRRRKNRRTTDAVKALRDASARSSVDTFRLDSLEAGQAHVVINRTLSIATAFKIIELLRQDHADAS